jgi:hypothetical protein
LLGSWRSAAVMTPDEARWQPGFRGCEHRQPGHRATMDDEIDKLIERGRD